MYSIARVEGGRTCSEILQADEPFPDVIALLRDSLEPPRDLVESTPFLAILTCVRERPAVVFLAQSVARRFEQAGLVRVLPVSFPQGLRPVDIITLRGRRRPSSAEALLDCVRRVAQSIWER